MLLILRYLTVFMLLLTPSTKALDCDLGIYPGQGKSNGTLLHAFCGNKWRVIYAHALTHDDASMYGEFTDNRYNFMLGAGYRWIFKKHRFDVGVVYIDKDTKLFNQRHGAVWIRWSYPILPSLHCGVAHQSVPFVNDAGRNQIGCDFSFTFGGK